MDQFQFLMKNAPATGMRESWEEAALHAESAPDFLPQLGLGSHKPLSRKDQLIGDLKARREVLGWSIKEVGNRTGLGGSVIARWERGDVLPRLDAVAKWASALGLTLSVTPAEDEARRGLYVDWEAQRISVDGTPVRLTPMEWRALERLGASPGELVPHLDLFRHLYGEDAPYRAQSTAIRVMITKLRRMLPPLQIKAQWGRGYIVSGIASSSPRGTAQAEAAAEAPAKPPPPRPDKPWEPAALSRSSIEPGPDEGHPKLRETSHPEIPRLSAKTTRPSSCRADELMSIERFLAERGVTRCPDVVATLVWDKIKRKWVRPPIVAREAS